VASQLLMERFLVWVGEFRLAPPFCCLNRIGPEMCKDARRIIERVSQWNKFGEDPPFGEYPVVVHTRFLGEFSGPWVD